MPPGTPRNVPWLFGRELVLAGEPGAARALHWQPLSVNSIARTDFAADWLTVEPAAGRAACKDPARYRTELKRR